MNNIMSEYNYEYPIKMLQKRTAIKPNSHQDWAKMGEDGNKISMYKNVFLAPEGHIKAISSKPKPRMINNSAKMDSVTGYRADYTGASSGRPMQVRPRSSHRDNVTDKQFHATTENGKSYRSYTDNERKTARQKFKRMGSTHGHVDSKNSEKLSSMTTHGEDFQGKSFARSRAIIPVNNKMNFGDQISDNQTNYNIDFAPILGSVRQEPVMPAQSQKPMNLYDGPSVSTHTEDFINHQGFNRQKAFLPDRTYRPSTAPSQKESSYTNTYKKWGVQKKEETPWADLAKKRTVQAGNYGGDIPSTNYSCDFQNGNINSKRAAIRPPNVSWSDRPPFDGTSQYKERFTGGKTDRVKGYGPVRTYQKPTESMDGTSTARDAFQGHFVAPPISCKPERSAETTNGPMDSMTEYRYRYHS